MLRIQPAFAASPVPSITQVVRKGENPPKIIARAPPNETPVERTLVGNISANAEGPAPEYIANTTFMIHCVQKKVVNVMLETMKP